MKEKEIKGFYNLKRILSLFTIIVMIMSLFAPYSTVRAESDIEIKLNSNCSSITVGEEIIIEIIVKNDSVAGFSGFLNYDEDVFEPVVKGNFSASEELESGTYGNWTPSYNKDNKYFRITEDDGDHYVIPSGVIATLKLIPKVSVDSSEVKFTTVQVDGETDIDDDAGYHELEFISQNLPIPTSTHKVTYNFEENDGANVNAPTTAVDVAEGASINLSYEATKDGYTFVGWNTNKDAQVASNPFVMGENDVELFAIFSKEVKGIFHYYDASATAQTFTPEVKGTMYNKDTEATITTPTISVDYKDANGNTWTKKGWTKDTTSVNPTIINENVEEAISAEQNYYMVYEREINVTYNSNGGTDITKTTIDGLSAVVNSADITNISGKSLLPVSITIEQPTKDGYTFANKWNTKADGSGTEYTSGQTDVTFTEDTTLYAMYTPKTYTIKYNGNGNNDSDTAMEDTSYVYGTEGGLVLRTNTYNRTGYSFKGWATTDSATTAEYTTNTIADSAIPGLANPDNEIILYAVWEAGDATYTIEHWKENSETGVYEKDDSLTQTPGGTSGDTVTLTADNAQDIEGYEFDATIDGTKLTGTIEGDNSLVLRMNYKIKRSDVTFYDEDGTTVLKETQQVKYGEDAVPPADPTKAEDNEYTYEFAGWEPSYENIKENTNIKAKYNKTAKNYEVKFVDEDGTEINKKSDYHYNDNLDLPADPTKEATAEKTYEFKGWYDEADETKAIIDLSTAKVTKDITYKAYFEEANRKYIVTFYNDDKTEKLDEVEVEYGNNAEYSKEAPTKKTNKEAGHVYTFEKWVKEDGTTEDDLSNVIENRAVYASYKDEIATYIVTFNPNGGNVTPTSKPVTYGETYGELPTPTLTGYDFVGWFDAIDSENEIKSDTQVTQTKDHILHAHWEIIKYTVRFVGKVNDGSPEGIDGILRTAQVEYNNTIQPSKLGFSLNDLKADVKTPKYTYTVNTTTPFTGDLNSPVTSDRTINVNYNEPTINKYKVTFMDEDKTTKLGEDEVDYGATANDAATNPEKAEDDTYTYTFDEWTTAEGTKDDLSNVIAERTVYAKYLATYKNYEVKFVSEDGTEVSKNSEYHYNDELIVPADLTKEQTAEKTYKFLGWYDESDEEQKVIDLSSTKVTKAITYKAKFEEETRKYTITFYDEKIEGQEPTKLEDAEVEYGKKAEYSKGTPTKDLDEEGFKYTFDKWVDEEGNEVDLDNIASDKAVYATYTKETAKFTVKFLKDDDTQIGEAQSIEYGQDAEAPENPTKDADVQYTYEFEKWDNEYTNVKADVNVKAVFTKTPISYTIEYVNTKDVENTNPTSYTIETADFTLQGLSKVEHNVFDGWYEDEAYTKPFEGINKDTMGNIKLYAKWKDEELWLKSDIYKITKDTISDTDNIREYEKDDLYIYKVAPKTTVGQFKANCTTNDGAIIKVYKADGVTEVADDEIVGTGMILVDTFEGQEKPEIRLTIGVIGDIDGDGYVMAADLASTVEKTLDMITLSRIQFLSIDMDDDNDITAADLAEEILYTLK